MIQHLRFAFRLLARESINSVINIVSLTSSFAIVLALYLYVQDELSFDKWLPDAARTFLVTFENRTPGREVYRTDLTPPEFASWMKQDFAGIEVIARIAPERVALRQGDIESLEEVIWADPTFPSVLKLEFVMAGGADSLHVPDSVVLSETAARRFFPNSDAIGKTIELNRKHTLTVTGVFRDIPQASHLRAEVFASGVSSYSRLSELDKARPVSGNSSVAVYTYFNIVNGAEVAEIQKSMSNFFERWSYATYHNNFGISFSFPIFSVTDVHLAPASAVTLAPRGSKVTVYALSAISFLILIVGLINFANLLAARSAKRTREFALRKALGATPHDIVFQFIVEVLPYVAVSLVLTIPTMLFLKGYLSDVVGRELDWPLSRIAGSATAVLLLISTAAALAALHPALRLASTSISSILKGGNLNIGSGKVVRITLVALQFAILVTLIAATHTAYRQTQFAFTNKDQLPTEGLMTVEALCTAPLRTELRKIPGILSVSCASPHALGFTQFNKFAVLPDGQRFQTARAPIDARVFETLMISPIAGRLFAETRAADAPPLIKDEPFTSPIVINEAARTAYGFDLPSTAVGKFITYMEHAPLAGRSEIIGVVQDFSLDAANSAVPPTIYFVDESAARYFVIRFREAELPTILLAVDRLWSQLGEPRPINRAFLVSRVQENFKHLSQQLRMLGGFSAITVVIAALGLFGISSTLAHSRTREIGIRKAVGAGHSRLVAEVSTKLLMPALIGIVLAWPLSYVIMKQWLEQFAKHIDPNVFGLLIATGIALLFAFTAVIFHAIAVVRGSTVQALRYE